MKTIPWWEPQIGKHEYILIHKVLQSHFPNEGTLTKKFEDQIAKLLKVRHVVAVPNATAAMFLSLKALGISHGDEVIVPDITFIATANAVEMSGAKAVLADVNPKTLTLDIHSFEKAITKQTRAVIPVHVSGRGTNIYEIIKIAKNKNLYVIEDSAEAFMSKYKGKYLGTFGQTGCFSLSPAKTITTGQGGLIVTNDDKIYRALKELKDQGRRARGTGGDDIHYSLGFNFKFTDLQAAVGLGQLRYLKTRIRRMRRNYDLYRKHLKDVKEVLIFDFKIQEGELPQWTDALVEKRDALVTFLKKYNVDCRRFWYPIHTQAYYKRSNNLFPISSMLSPKAVWLPSAFTMNDSDVKHVCTLIKRFFSHE